MNVWKKLVVLFVLAFLSGCTTTGSVGDKDFKTVGGSSLIHGEMNIEGLGGDVFFADIAWEGRRDWALTKVEKFCPNYQTIANKEDDAREYTQEKDTLDNVKLSDRLDPTMLDPFKQNPYTQSLASFAY